MEDESFEKDLLAAHDAYADAIFRHCYYKTGERELAQDLTQEVFLKAWSYMQSKQPILNMRALLYRISDNLVIDWYRKRKTQSLDVLVEQGFEPRDTGVHIEEKAEMGLALAKLRELNPNDQKIIIWRFVEDWTLGEIAGALGLKENAVSVRLNRALKRLRALLQ
jgi:RNA polymerase sigma-70 factor (ECF subfamily)